VRWGVTQDQSKLLAAKRATDFISDGMKVGLGTGTTSTFFIKELGKRVRSGLRITAIATSAESAKLATEQGIELTNFDDSPVLDVNVDGADEIGPGLSLIKGGHGALLREKIIASAAKKFVVIADESKIVSTLGKFPLPVEVIQLAKPLVYRKLLDLGLNPMLRLVADGAVPWQTDEGNFILDCHCGSIQDPEKTADEIRSIIGVVEHGLFLRMASMALIAGEDGIREVHPS
jgi:ribose 5-phosphate isomerase A